MTSSSQIEDVFFITDPIFEEINRRLQMTKSVQGQVGAIFMFNISKHGHATGKRWTVDMKSSRPAAYEGSPQEGNPACVIDISDEDMVALAIGELDPVKAFMSGRIKIRGNPMLTQKLDVLFKLDSTDVNTDNSLVQTSNNTSKHDVDADAGDDGNAHHSSVLDVDKIPCTGLKCDLIFNIIMNRCHEEPELLQKIRVVVQFNITRQGKPMCVWTVDNKSMPDIHIYRQAAKHAKPDVTVTVDDDDILKIMAGKLNPQRLFMMGKVKVKGNIMLLQKLHRHWLQYEKLGKTPELPDVIQVMMKDPIRIGLKSEAMIIDLMQRVVKLKELPDRLPGLHQFDITKDGKLVSSWTLDFKTGRKTFTRGPVDDGEPTLQLQIDDTDFARLVYMQVRLADCLANGRVKIIKGGQEQILQLDPLFTTPTSLKPKL